MLPTRLEVLPLTLQNLLQLFHDHVLLTLISVVVYLMDQDHIFPVRSTSQHSTWHLKCPWHTSGEGMSELGLAVEKALALPLTELCNLGKFSSIK